MSEEDRIVPLGRKRAERQGKTPACPICGKPPTPERKPFCSTRCAEIDLGRWLKGGYRIETDERPADAGEDTAREDEA
jgi:endogenous inhibitor of DNA gyrase (YacG/DUF329 family)